MTTATAFAGAAALDEFAENPRRKRDQHEKNAEPENIRAVIAGGEVEQPHGGQQHREAHGDLEFLHPRAGLGQKFQPRRIPAQHDIRRGEAESDKQKNQHNHRRALGEGKAERRCQKRRGAGRGQAVASRPLKNAPGAPCLEASWPAALKRASAERDFKHAEQIQRHERDERGEQTMKTGLPNCIPQPA